MKTSRFFCAISFLLALAVLASCDSASDEEIEVVRYTGSQIKWEHVPEWSASMENGIVTLRFAFLGTEEERECLSLKSKDVGHIDPGEMVVLTLQDRSTDLPLLLSAGRSPVPGYKGTYKPIRMGPMLSGKIEIESWDLEGELRGRIVGRMGAIAENVDIPFTAMLSDSPECLAWLDGL